MSINKLDKHLPWIWKHKIKALIIIGLALVIVALSITNIIARHNDQKKFAEFDHKKDRVIAGLVDYLGDNVSSTEDRDACFRSEQGPYGNGTLWCQVGTIIRLKNDVAYTDVGDKFMSISRDAGLSPEMSTYVQTRYWFKADSNRDCRLQYVNSQGDLEGENTRSLLSRNDHSAIAIGCADRAKATHYPFGG